MKKYLLTLTVSLTALTGLTSPVWAQRIHNTPQNDVNAIYPAGTQTSTPKTVSTKVVPKVVAPVDFDPDAPKNPPLTKDETTAIVKRKRWNQSVSISPFVGGKGSVKFVFGAQDPTIVCAVRQVCDIALQPGEQLNAISVGDATRWNIVPAITGSGDNATEHLILKPLIAGSETSMVVATDRRTYHFLLHSSSKDFMPYVSFAYPEDFQARLAALKAKEQKERQDKTIPETGEYLGNLNFNYCIKGKAAFKPVRVYDDGVKTLIDFPPSVSATDAPTLLVKSPFTKTPGLVNSRLQNNRLIVDKIFNEAVLIAGVGSHQQKIKIYRGGCH